MRVFSTSSRNRSGIRLLLAPALLVASLAACGGDDPSPEFNGPSGVPTGPSIDNVSPSVADADEARADDDEIVVDPGVVVGRFDRRLLGTNAPAWISAAQIADPVFRQHVEDSGTTLIRMPGGSWSSDYEWLACETGDGCAWSWALRPTDFVDFLAATDIPGMWTVSLNGTAEEAAALVAFFNGDVDDTRPIGTDRLGRDWKTVGTWAALRAAGGHPEPQPIDLWEVGNEVYGAKSDVAGPACASFGWENVWTCEGDEYVEGTDDHDGFLTFRQKMQEVDPDIAVGAVGIGGEQDGWGNFGNEVIDAAGSEMDFYIVHDYGFDTTRSMDEVLERPRRAWAGTMEPVREALDAASPDQRIPVGITEYNLFSFVDGDSDGQMAEAVNALYLADTIGQMATQGAEMANQWNLINGVTDTGSDYGMFDPNTLEPNPAFYTLSIWSSFGEEMIAFDNGFDADRLTVYAGRDAAGATTLMVINKTGDPIDANLRIVGGGTFDATSDQAAAEALDAQTLTWNGVDDVSTDPAAHPPTQLGPIDGAGATQTYAPYSITMLRLTPTAAG